MAEESKNKPESVMDRLMKKNAEAMKKLKEKREVFESKGGYRSGGKVCKLATKGKGRAYGKNS